MSNQIFIKVPNEEMSSLYGGDVRDMFWNANSKECLFLEQFEFFFSYTLMTPWPGGWNGAKMGTSKSIELKWHFANSFGWQAKNKGFKRGMMNGAKWGRQFKSILGESYHCGLRLLLYLIPQTFPLKFLYNISLCNKFLSPLAVSAQVTDPYTSRNSFSTPSAKM